ncbi:hypothetical protein JHK87_054623 [Glycine soja]|nr:hypothetical protein JHK87_054623 [Glycine soja]
MRGPLVVCENLLCNQMWLLSKDNLRKRNGWKLHVFALLTTSGNSAAFLKAALRIKGILSHGSSVEELYFGTAVSAHFLAVRARLEKLLSS